MKRVLVRADQSLMSPEGVQSPVALTALTTGVLLLLKSLEILLTVLQRGQQVVALLLMTFQTVDARISSTTAVATELLAGFGAPLYDAGLDGI